MRKQAETAADRLWKEKLDECASTQEAIVVMLLIVFAVVSMLVA